MRPIEELVGCRIILPNFYLMIKESSRMWCSVVW